MPREAVGHFLKWQLNLPQGGVIPSDVVFKSADGLIQQDLVNAFLSARELEARCLAVTPPDMAAPMWQGDAFNGVPEKPTEVEIGDVQELALGVEIPVRLIYISSEYEVGDPRRVTSVAVRYRLVEKGWDWLISDIIQADGDSLTSKLSAWIKNLQGC